MGQSLSELLGNVSEKWGGSLCANGSNPQLRNKQGVGASELDPQAKFGSMPVFV